MAFQSNFPDSRLGDDVEISGGIYKTTDDSYMQLQGGTNKDDSGSMMSLYGKSHTSKSGHFEIHAKDGVKSAVLVGCPDGTLTWNGNNISVNAPDGTNITGGKIWIE